MKFGDKHAYIYFQILKLDHAISFNQIDRLSHYIRPINSQLIKDLDKMDLIHMQIVRKDQNIKYYRKNKSKLNDAI